MPDYYLCEAGTLKAVAGPFGDPFTVAGLVDAQDDPTKYGTVSRHQLAKVGRYPKNKAGEADLIADVDASGKYKVPRLYIYAVVKCKKCGNIIKRRPYGGWIHVGYDEHGALEPAMTPTMDICGKAEPAQK